MLTKIILKILLFPLVFILRFVWFIASLLMQISMWVLSPIILFALGCGIYCVVKARWSDVFLLTLIEMGLFALSFGAGMIVELVENLCDLVEAVTM